MLPDALAEMGVEVPDAPAATRVVFEGLAARCLSGRLPEREVAQAVWRVYVDRDYAPEVWDEPLGVVGAMDDEWDAGWGRGGRPERRRPSSARQRPSTVPNRALDGCIVGGRDGGRDGMRGEAA